MAKGWLIALISLAVAGVVLVCIGLGLLPYYNSRITPEVEQNVILKNNTEGYKNWLSPAAPIYIDFYFFHVLNPDEILNGSKPRVEQRGPYVYREIRQKIFVHFENDEKELTYRETKSYIFDAEKSNGTETDNITSLDISLVTAAEFLRYKISDRWQNFVSRIISALGGKLFTEKTVHEWLFGFTPDIIMKLVTEIPFLRPFLSHITVGFYVGSTGNGTDGGPLEILTGVSDVNKLGEIEKWKDSSSVSYWNSNYSNMINGTDGTLWHPFVKSSERLYSFITDMCRSVYLQYDASARITPSRILVYQYKVPPELLANQSINPDNIGFCPDGYCMKAGVLNVSACRNNAPVVMSQVHFLDADEEYQNAIEGLQPHNEAFRTVIDVEPTTGVVLNATKKLQMNFYVRANLKSFEPTSHLKKDILFPIFWANEHATISDEDAAKFSHKVLQMLTMYKILIYSLIGLGCLFIIVVIVLSLIIYLRQRNSANQTSAADDDDEPLITDAAD